MSRTFGIKIVYSLILWFVHLSPPPPAEAEFWEIQDSIYSKAHQRLVWWLLEKYQK